MVEDVLELLRSLKERMKVAAVPGTSLRHCRSVLPTRVINLASVAADLLSGNAGFIGNLAAVAWEVPDLQGYLAAWQRFFWISAQARCQKHTNKMAVKMCAENVM